MPLQSGQVVAAKLRLVRPLGAGGMGSVWIADHLTLKTQVAVKFMSDELSGNTEALARFSREAAAAARIKSPHVVKVFDFGVWERTPYMVLELLEGEDLATRIQRCEALDIRETAVVVEQAARALEQAHQLGIVHRDIKPANVFVTPSGNEIFVRLLDFGIARAEGLDFSMKTETGATLGTPLYMSPQQLFRQGALDGRTDLWSLAVVAYECLTGTLPFQGTTLAALGVAINDGVFRPPSLSGRALTPGVDAFFARAFARDLGARFQTARELADAFHAAAGLELTHLSIPRYSVTPRFSAASFAKTELAVPTLGAATAPTSTPRTAPGRGARIALAALVLVSAASVLRWNRHLVPALSSTAATATAEPEPTAGATATDEPAPTAGATAAAAATEPVVTAEAVASASAAVASASAAPAASSSGSKPSAPPRRSFPENVKLLFRKITGPKAVPSAAPSAKSKR